MGSLLFGLAKLGKCLTFAFAPFLAAAMVTAPSDEIYKILVAVLCTLLGVTAFVNSYVNFESRFVQWFSHLTSSPRWFTIWLLLMVLWVPVRHLLIERGLISSDGDFLVATILWSCIPFMVENVLKSASAKALALITELLIEIHAAQERAAQQDQLHYELMLKLLDALEERQKEEVITT